VTTARSAQFSMSRITVTGSAETSASSWPKSVFWFGKLTADHRQMAA
jgi:hypothetical protein